MTIVWGIKFLGFQQPPARRATAATTVDDSVADVDKCCWRCGVGRSFEYEIGTGGRRKRGGERTNERTNERERSNGFCPPRRQKQKCGKVNTTTTTTTAVAVKLTPTKFSLPNPELRLRLRPSERTEPLSLVSNEWSGVGSEWGEE